MTSLLAFFTGLLLASSGTVLFRIFFIISKYPFYHLPIIAFIFLMELLLGILLYKKLSGIITQDKLFSISLTLFSAYLPLLEIITVNEKILLGLSFNSALPWYAFTVYPAITLLPAAVALGIFMSLLLQIELDLRFLITGLLLFFLSDYLYLWQISPLYTSVIASVAGFVILLSTSYTLFSKLRYGLLAVLFIAFSFTPLPDKITTGVKSFTRRKGVSFAETKITPYGELCCHLVGKNYRYSINHSQLFNYPDTKRVQEIVHMCMLQYPWAENVLVIGEGKEIIDEIMRYPSIKSIYWTTPVPESITAFSGVMPLRFSKPEELRILKTFDPRTFIRKLGRGSTFDVVILSIPDPLNIFFNRYYTHEFFLELKKTLSDHSIVSINMITGGANANMEEAILSSAIYNTLKLSFPNLFEMTGQQAQILASHDRNFSNSYKALAEFLNAIDGIPEYISPSLIRYKLNSRERMSEMLQAGAEQINTDSKPASLRFSLNRLILTFGIYPNFLINIANHIKPLHIYIFLLVLLVLLIKLLYRSNLRVKLLALAASITFSAVIFFYASLTALYTASGQTFRVITLTFTCITAGITIAVVMLRKTEAFRHLSAIMKLLMLNSLFLILLPVAFETSLSPPSEAMMAFFLTAGGFFWGGILFISGMAYENISENEARPSAILPVTVYGMLLAAMAAITAISIMGTIDIFPALGLLCLGAIILLST